MELQKTGYTDLNYLITMTFQVTYLVILFMPMIFLYYHANELRLESMEIGTNVFHNNWYEQSPSNRKRFLIMMIRAEMPLELKIGNLNGISAELIVKITKKAFDHKKADDNLYSSQPHRDINNVRYNIDYRQPWYWSTRSVNDNEGFF
ncbi:hypothetical protein NQ317_019585 [Molorchus minor]|uniref:Odorant receptor n=1 Tax=Molorchus minor TaxID=1323400 RepID=A0ABQ9IRE6_9CUCU|nr:hypothetical protein NQ317_019585 [Molorchus minor]